MYLMILWVAAAFASGNYPSALEAELGMACAPACTACHTTNGGGAGTVTAAFGVAMMDRGLTGGGQESSLLDALAQLEADGVDSDGDGTPDVDALTAGADPNGGAPFCGEDALPTPTYGCFNHTPGLASLAVVGAIAALTRRRRAG